tara:strand:- start:381 stop:1073 length:693 start_codon:yes stop_codon:yes gene_type:complete
MNYYSHHIGDYKRDTAHLSLLEHGAYRQLLDMYYLSELKIPEETEVVYRRLCARTEEEKKAVNTVLFEFFKRDEGWVHTRCEKEISEYLSKADRARNNGKLGGRPPKTKVVISGNLEETKEKANHKPLTINHKPLLNPETKKTRNPTKTFIPNDFKVSERVEAWAKEKGFANLDRHLENFISACKAKGYQYVDFDEALMSAIRNNWAKVEAKNTATSQAALVDIRWRGAK